MTFEFSPLYSKAELQLVLEWQQTREMFTLLLWLIEVLLLLAQVSPIHRRHHKHKDLKSKQQPCNVDNVVGPWSRQKPELLYFNKHGKT